MQEQFARMAKEGRRPSPMGAHIYRGMGFADGGTIGQPMRGEAVPPTPWQAPTNVVADPQKMSSGTILDHAGHILDLAKTFEKASQTHPGGEYVAIHKEFLRHSKRQLELAAKQLETLLRVLEDHDLAE